MIRLKRTNSKDVDFISLVQLLDGDLAQRDGEDHARAGAVRLPGDVLRPARRRDERGARGREARGGEAA